jgi:hypothetical protein
LRVTSAAYADADHKTIRANIDGMDVVFTDDPASENRLLVAEWEATGNTITPFAETREGGGRSAGSEPAG